MPIARSWERCKSAVIKPRVDLPELMPQSLLRLSAETEKYLAAIRRKTVRLVV
jgi:hypothetical protein